MRDVGSDNSAGPFLVGVNPRPFDVSDSNGRVSRASLHGAQDRELMLSESRSKLLDRIHTLFVGHEDNLMAMYARGHLNKPVGGPLADRRRPVKIDEIWMVLTRVDSRCLPLHERSSVEAVSFSAASRCSISAISAALSSASFRLMFAL